LAGGPLQRPASPAGQASFVNSLSSSGDGGDRCAQRGSGRRRLTPFGTVGWCRLASVVSPPPSRDRRV
jgi:hypothetical protein